MGLNASNPDPRKVHCNNCDSDVEFDLLQNPAAMILTLTDSLGGEVFQCPNCGIRDPDNMDGVTVE